MNKPYRYKDIPLTRKVAKALIIELYSGKGTKIVAVQDGNPIIFGWTLTIPSTLVLGSFY